MAGEVGEFLQDLLRWIKSHLKETNLQLEPENEWQHFNNLSHLRLLAHLSLEKLTEGSNIREEILARFGRDVQAKSDGQVQQITSMGAIEALQRLRDDTDTHSDADTDAGTDADDY